MTNEPLIVVFPLKLNLHLKEGYLKQIVELWDIEHDGFKVRKADNKEYCIKTISDHLNGLVNTHNCLKGVIVEKDKRAYLVPAGPLELTDNNKTDPGIDVIALQRRCKDNLEQKQHLNSIDIDPSDPILSEALKILRNSSGEDIPHWPIIFSLKMNDELHIDEEKFTVEPEKSQEIEISTNMVEAGDNKPKLTITTFKPEITTSDAWINDSVFICDLLGVKDPEKVVALLLSKIPENLMSTVTSSLQEHKKNGKLITTQAFQEFLRIASKRSKIQIDSDLANAKITHSESFRDFFLRIKNLVRMSFPKADEQTLEKIAIREFKTKVPNIVRNNVNFKTCQADSVILVDTAQSINDAIKNQQHESNFFRANNYRGRGQRSNRGNFRGNNRGTYSRGHNHRGQPRQNFNSYSMTANNQRNYNSGSYNSGSFNYSNNQTRPNTRWGSQNNSYRGQYRPMNNVRCHNCGKMGHIAKNCFQPKYYAGRTENGAQERK